MIQKAALPRLKEVADLAGVSTATVSRFFNNADVVAPKTAERIRNAVEQTGYVPNLLAGGLASSRSKLVAVLVPELGASLFTDTVQEMIEEMSRDGISVMLGITRPDNSHLAELIDSAIARRADAVVLTSIVDDPKIRERLLRSDITVIETWGMPKEPVEFSIGFEHEDAGAEIARYLRRRGYSRPHLVVADGDRARARRDGFLREWAKDHDLAPSQTMVEIPSRFGHGRMVLRRMLDLDLLPDVVVCGSDMLAQSIIIEAGSKGISIPDQLGVFGFGNLAIAEEMRPSISTVDIDGVRIGHEAASLLRRKALGETITQTSIDVGFRIIGRDSA